MTNEERESAPEGLQLFQEAVEILEGLEITYWLDQGSLLGAVREGAFLPWDHDLDLGVWEEEVKSKLSEIVDELRFRGAQVTVTPYVVKVKGGILRSSDQSVDLRIYRLCQGAAYSEYRSSTEAVNAHWLLKRFKAACRRGIIGGHKVCRFALKKMRGEGSPTGRAFSFFKGINGMAGGVIYFLHRAIEALHDRRVLFRVEASFFNEFRKVKIHGMELPAPSRAEEYLELKYGQDWRSPRTHWKYWEDDGALYAVRYLNRGRFFAALVKLVRKIWSGVLSLAGEAFSRLIPQSSKLVLFGSRSGEYYIDNSRHFFEWAWKHRSDLRPVWVTGSRRVFSELRAKKLPVVYTKSAKGVFLLWRAGAAAYTNRLRDIAAYPELIPSNLKLLALGHGQPVKKYRFTLQPEDRSPFGQELRRAARLTERAVSSSDFITQIDAPSQGIAPEKYVITGYPRNDVLLAPTEEQDQAMKAWLQEFTGGKGSSFTRKDGSHSFPHFSNSSPEKTDSNNKIILYAPTWRKFGSATRFFPFADFKEEDLLECLREQNYMLLLRPHFQDLRGDWQQAELLQRLLEKPEVGLASSRELPDVNSLLPYVDVLVTDYSSIYHDFLLLDRTMLFIPYDYEEFNRKNGFLYDYFATLPGPALNNFAEFDQALRDPKGVFEKYRDKHRALKDRIHYYQDPGACHRIGAPSGVLDQVLWGKK